MVRGGGSGFVMTGKWSGVPFAHTRQPFCVCELFWIDSHYKQQTIDRRLKHIRHYRLLNVMIELNTIYISCVISTDLRINISEVYERRNKHIFVNVQKTKMETAYESIRNTREKPNFQGAETTRRKLILASHCRGEFSPHSFFIKKNWSNIKPFHINGGPIPPYAV